MVSRLLLAFNPTVLLASILARATFVFRLFRTLIPNSYPPSPTTVLENPVLCRRHIFKIDWRTFPYIFRSFLKLCL